MLLFLSVPLDLVTDQARFRACPNEKSDLGPATQGDRSNYNFRFLAKKPPGVQPSILAVNCLVIDAFLFIFTEDIINSLVKSINSFASPLTTRTVRWVDSIPDSTWEEKEVENSRRRSRRDNSAGKEVGIEDESQVEKKMSPCPDERQSIGDNLPWSPLTTRGNHSGAYSSPGPTRGELH
ncbi:hypothetical protein PoB_004528600 [Plakobranchus ocellatus]|uniref:Uncharacterized protein n=1 Tax=Plakobranchus ocellatus TaxID=259542 RepID=A0AAV4BIM6_9GAST|nr:hypothetical protein PoB_004528600 [Plakobranchus ocellatus]